MSYKLSAFWGSSHETPAECAARLARMLEGLATVHPALARWYKQGYSRATSNRPFCSSPPRVAELAKAFEQGRYYTDDQPRALMPDLGFDVSAWNGHDDAYGVSMSVHAGAWSERRRECNSAFFETASPAAGNRDLLNAAVLRRALLAIALPWEASWGIVESWAYSGQTLDANDKPLRPYGGWVTYLAAPYAAKLAIPDGTLAEPVEGGGVVILATDEIFSADNPAHVAGADAVQKILRPIQFSITGALPNNP